MISIETTTKLLKLHLRWPDRKNHNGKDSEAIEFYKWLFVNYFDRPEVSELEDVTYVEDFLTRNKHVLWPARKEEKKWENLRLEPRIEQDVNIDLTVTLSDDIEALGTNVQGKSLDIGLHGMRVAIPQSIPDGSDVKLKVAKDIADAKVYELTATIRWVTNLEDGYLIGVRLVEDAGFEAWQSDFGVEFVAPVLAR